MDQRTRDQPVKEIICLLPNPDFLRRNIGRRFQHVYHATLSFKIFNQKAALKSLAGENANVEQHLGNIQCLPWTR